MGRGNYYASGDYAAQWYVEYEPDILEEAFQEIEERFPSFHKHDNEHTIAVFLSSKDDGVTDGLAVQHFGTYKKGILNILLSFFDEVYVPTSSWTSQKIQSI